MLPGAVLQIFGTGFYVCTTGPCPRVLPVLGPGALELPTGLRCPGLDHRHLAGISTGDPVLVHTDRTGLVRALETDGLQLRAARTWRPTRIARRRVQPVAARPSPAAAPRAAAGGAAEVLATIAAHTGHSDLARRGRELLAALTERSPALTSAVHHLLGFGPGSTPSGDDLLCGVALALRAGGQDSALALLREHLPGPLLYARTPALSASLIEAALAGYCLPQTARAIASLADLTDPEPALQLVSGIGHSSGYDLLLGAALAHRARGAPEAPADPATATARAAP